MLLPATEPNRAPGDLKPSHKWSPLLNQSRTEGVQQPLSQAHWYMNRHRAKYGFILTDRELVAIHRVDDDGHLLLSNAIPLEPQKTAAQPQLTVLLAL